MAVSGKWWNNTELGRDTGVGIMSERVKMDIEIRGGKSLVVFTITFLDTGEIRQKRRSMEWVMKRVFQSELKTWYRNHGDVLELKLWIQRE